MIKSNLRSLSDDQLKNEFRIAWNRTAEGIRQMAEIWQVMEERGMDLSEYHNPMLSFLPDVANGKLLPEVLLSFGARPSILSALTRLVPEVQRKYVKPNAKLAVMMPNDIVREIPIRAFGSDLIHQVFGEGKIRTPAQQKRFMPRSKKTALPRISRDPSPYWNDEQKADADTRAHAAGITTAEYIAKFMAMEGGVCDPKKTTTKTRNQGARNAASQPVCSM